MEKITGNESEDPLADQGKCAKGFRERGERVGHTPPGARKHSLQLEWELTTKTHGFRVLQGLPRGCTTSVFLQEAE